MTAPGVDLADRVNILVVDDRGSKLIAMEALLADLGENVVCVSSGADALRQLLERDFAVVLLDVNMPDMDGFETATLIRQLPRLRHIPIIFMTAGSDDTHALRGYSLGAVDYILTPVIPEVLQTKVKVFVELFKMAEQLKRQADQRVALAEERAARATAESQGRRAGFLADAGKRMARSLDVDSTVESILRLVVPEIADFAALRLCVGGEDLVKTLHRDEGAGVSVAPALADAMQSAVRSLSTQVVPAAGAPDQAVQGLACPLLARGTTVGVLGMMFERSRPLGDPSTVMLIEDLCARAAIAVDNCLLYREIQDRDVRKDQFLAMLAHELRNPLAAISSALGILDTFRDHEASGDKARDAIRRQLQNLTQLIDDLVDVARITTGKITMTRLPVNLAESAKRCLTGVAGRSREHAIGLESRDTWIVADAVRVDQILTNLMENARKYTPEGGSIRIRVEPDGAYGIFEIEDTGAGMAPHVLAHAFDLFFQGDRSPDRGEGGLGIGLTLVRQLVELHGGAIEAASVGEGLGSRFTVRLPRCAEPVPVSEDALVAVPETRADPSRILIVEDNEDARQMLKLLLTLAAHEVYDAPDAPSGIELAEAVEPEIALVDLGLPGVDGYEVARQLRARRGKDVYLIALSGYGQVEDRRRALEAGFDLHVVKPVDPARLSSLIALQQRRRREAPAKDALDHGRG
jgi:signal transduction histidine kinase/DNA-binding response OmpR family regulator